MGARSLVCDVAGTVFFGVGVILGVPSVHCVVVAFFKSSSEHILLWSLSEKYLVVSNAPKITYHSILGLLYFQILASLNTISENGPELKLLPRVETTISSQNPNHSPSHC